jgi:hypothetical protein
MNLCYTYGMTTKKWISKPKPLRNGEETRKDLVKELTKLTSKIVILRDGDCVTPGGCSGFMTNSHFFPTANLGTKFNLVNCNAQCSGHNYRHYNHNNSNPAPYTEYMVRTYSREQLLEISRLAKIQGYKYTIADLIKLRDEYQKILSDLESAPRKDDNVLHRVKATDRKPD